MAGTHSLRRLLGLLGGRGQRGVSSYIHTPNRTPWIRETLGELTARHAEDTPDQEAFVFRNPGQPREALTWQQLDDRSGRLAAAFVRDGLVPGERALVWGPSSSSYIETDTALARTGVASIRQSQSILDANTMTDVINKHGCAALVLHPGVDGVYLEETMRLFPDLLRGVQPDGSIQSRDHPTLRRVYVMSPHSDTSAPCTAHLIDAVPPDWRDVTAARERQFDHDAICVVFQTSGTTGKPKAIPWSHFGIVNNMKAFSQSVDIGQTSRYFNDRPLSWIGCFSYIPFALGNTNIYTQVSTTLLERNVDFLTQVLREEHCSTGLLMKYLLYDLCMAMEQGHIHLPALRDVSTGGEVLEAELQHLARKHFGTVYQMYGQSECCFVSAVPVTHNKHPESIGQPIPGTEVKIADDNGVIVPEGDVGEIYVRAATNVYGYLDNEELTRATETPHRWWKTGDTGYTRAGSLHILGRKHEMISHAARKFPPVYIENLIISHPAVEAACAFGMPDVRLGEAIWACVVVKPGHALTQQEVIDHSLGHAKGHETGAEFVVEHVEFVSQIPLTRTGKVDRRTLKAQVLAAKGLAQ